jgi:hypothetical protein
MSAWISILRRCNTSILVNANVVAVLSLHVSFSLFISCRNLLLFVYIDISIPSCHVSFNDELLNKQHSNNTEKTENSTTLIHYEQTIQKCILMKLQEIKGGTSFLEQQNRMIMLKLTLLYTEMKSAFHIC